MLTALLTLEMHILFHSNGAVYSVHVWPVSKQGNTRNILLCYLICFEALEVLKDVSTGICLIWETWISTLSPQYLVSSLVKWS